jgi:hypothetical protein
MKTLKVIIQIDFPYTPKEGGTYVRCASEEQATVVVPNEDSCCFKIGTSVTIEQSGTCRVMVTAQDGVVLHAFGGGLGSAGQFAVMQLVKVGVNVWTVIGGVV